MFLSFLCQSWHRLQSFMFFFVLQLYHACEVVVGEDEVELPDHMIGSCSADDNCALGPINIAYNGTTADVTFCSSVITRFGASISKVSSKHKRLFMISSCEFNLVCPIMRSCMNVISRRSNIFNLIIKKVSCCVLCQ